MTAGSSRLWSIVLAGGEGERTREFIEERLGCHRPKQYCAFTGTRSLFQHTVDRADALSSPERRIVIAAAGHRKFVDEELRGRERGRVVFQPRNRGTAAGVFLALACVRGQDPGAVVVIYPSDHFVYPESAFLNRVRTAVRIAQSYPDDLVLLGAHPESPEPEYGWIVPARHGPDEAVRTVARFIEKPAFSVAEEAFRQGALWNTMIVAGRLGALWELGWERLPEIMPAFVRVSAALREGGKDALLEETYRHLPVRDFSSHVLQQAPQRLKVLELSGVWWSDWGRPERIEETLRVLAEDAAHPDALDLDPKEVEVEWALDPRTSAS